MTYDLPLVITPKQKESVRVPDLQSEQVEYTFDAERTSIHIIAEEKIASLARTSSDFE